MTHTAQEIFTMQLARGAAKTAHKFLKRRGLQLADRDDVIAAAMLWCWENRAKYSLTTSLETWFMNAIRDAYKKLRRGELSISDDSIDNMGGADETFNRASAESSARTLIAALTPAHKAVVGMVVRGYTRVEILELNRDVSKRMIDETHRRVKQLRRLLPDEDVARLIARTPPLASDDADDKLTGIDVALERLDFPPPAGKDCPPCWRCKWFEGMLPDGKRSTRMEIADADVREAVKNTEARKIEIAQHVRSSS